MARAVSRRQGSAVAVALAVLGLLYCCSLPLAHAQLADKKVSDCFALSRARQIGIVCPQRAVTE